MIPTRPVAARLLVAAAGALVFVKVFAGPASLLAAAGLFTGWLCFEIALSLRKL